MGDHNNWIVTILDFCDDIKSALIWLLEWRFEKKRFSKAVCSELNHKFFWRYLEIPNQRLAKYTSYLERAEEAQNTLLFLDSEHQIELLIRKELAIQNYILNCIELNHTKNLEAMRLNKINSLQYEILFLENQLKK